MVRWFSITVHVWELSVDSQYMTHINEGTYSAPSPPLLDLPLYMHPKA